MLVGIYMMVVFTVMTWGVSQVTSPYVAANAGNGMVALVGHPGGFVLAFLQSQPAPAGLRFTPIEQVHAWESMFPSQRPRLRLWSDIIWVQPTGPGGTYAGVRYWAALLFLLGSFAVLKFQAYRKRVNRLTKS